MTIRFECDQCGASVEKPAGAVNRARKAGRRLFCNRRCAGLGRRKNRSKAEKVEAKRLYDIKYRKKNAARIKAQKAAYFQRTYDPAKAAIDRKKRSAQHAEYCRRPEYRAWKREYDRRYRAKKDYGEFADCFLLVQDIRSECLSRQSDYEIRLEQKTLNKRQKRKRDYDRLNREEPEIGPVGNPKRCSLKQNGARSG